MIGVIASSILAIVAAGGGVVVPPDPTGHRYWRMLITETNGYVDGHTHISELELYETEFGPNVALTGTASASSTYSNNTAAKAFDKDWRPNASCWSSNNALTTTHWLKYDFGAGVTKAIKAMRHFSRTPSSPEYNQRPKTYKLQWSDTGGNTDAEWTDHIVVVNGGVPAGDTTKKDVAVLAGEYLGSPHGKHRYWRIFGAQPDAANAISEIEFRATPGGADMTAPGGPVSVNQSFNGSTTGTNAIDNNTATIWSTSNVAGVLGYDFGVPVNVAEIAIRARNDANALNQSPTNFYVQHSDDNVNFTTAYSVNTGAWVANELRLFTDPSYRTEYTITQTKMDTTGTSISIPNTARQGELVVLHVAYGTNTDGAIATVPPGFTKHTLENDRAAGLVATKVAGANEPATYTISWAGSGASTATLTMVRVPDAVGTYDIQTAQATANTNTIPIAGHTKPTAKKRRLIFASGGWGGGVSTVNPDGKFPPLTTIPPVNTPGDNITGQASVVGYSDVLAGIELPASTLTHSNTAHGGLYWATFSLLLDIVPKPDPVRRYWRLLINSVQADTGADFYNVEFRYAEVDQTVPAEAAVRASASSFYLAGLEPALAFDAANNTRWASQFNNVWPQWIQWDFGANKNITSVYIQSYVPARSPKDWRVQWSEDAINWVDAYRHTAQVGGGTTYAYLGGNP